MSKRIDVDRVIRLAAKTATMIDVLPPKIYSEEHLPGAINVPLETFTPDAVSGFDRAKPIVVYCFDQH